MIAKAGHIPARANLSRQVEVAGVYNHHLEHARHTAERYSRPHVYEDCDTMLAELDPDVVSVTTPNSWHKPSAVKAFAEPGQRGVIYDQETLALRRRGALARGYFHIKACLGDGGQRGLAFRGIRR